MRRVLIFSLMALAGYSIHAWAQTVLNPAPVIAVCAYSTSPPTVTTGNFVYVQCTSTGQLSLH